MERERAIQSFQNDDSCRVFLISLKAGGVGLNLTAADYVYIVDPWWNPAVEQQAIDRTHRIGQTKNIFAYRMICKDTIEDKILQLQEKKRILAKDLIADDDGFVKSLTRADVEYLVLLVGLTLPPVYRYNSAGGGLPDPTARLFCHW